MVQEQRQQQLTLKVSKEELARLDELIEAGRLANRHAALRSAFQQMLDAEESALIDAQIIAGYTRYPDGDDEFLVAQARSAAKRSVAEESW